jgi:hypothetical protein
MTWQSSIKKPVPIPAVDLICPIDWNRASSNVTKVRSSDWNMSALQGTDDRKSKGNRRDAMPNISLYLSPSEPRRKAVWTKRYLEHLQHTPVRMFKDHRKEAPQGKFT